MPITTFTTNWATSYTNTTTGHTVTVGNSKMPKFKAGDIVRWVTFPKVSSSSKHVFVTESAYNERIGKDLVIETYSADSDAYRTKYKGAKLGGYWIPANCLVLISGAEIDFMAKLNFQVFIRELRGLSVEASKVAEQCFDQCKVYQRSGLGLDQFNEIKGYFKTIQKLIENHPEEDELEYIKDQIKDILSILSKAVKARTKEENAKQMYMEELKKNVNVKDTVPF